jgi:hypothetical protein
VGRLATENLIVLKGGATKMTDDLLTTVVQISGNLIGMLLKAGILSIPGVIGIVAGAPISLLAAGIGAGATILSALIFVGIFK